MGVGGEWGRWREWFDRDPGRGAGEAGGAPILGLSEMRPNLNPSNSNPVPGRLNRKERVEHEVEGWVPGA